MLEPNSLGASHARVAPTRTQLPTLTPTGSSRDTQDTSSVMHDHAVLNTGAIHTAPHTVNGRENSASRERQQVPLVNDNINMGRESTELNTDLEQTVNSDDIHDLSVDEGEQRNDSSFLEDFLDSAQEGSVTVQRESETGSVHVPSETEHAVDSPNLVNIDNVIAATAPSLGHESMIERMMAQMAVQHSQTMNAHAAINTRVENLAHSVAQTNDELASTNARVELLSQPNTTTFGAGALPRVREDDDEIEDLDERDGAVYSAIGDRRQSAFPGIDKAVLQKQYLPRRFMDGSAVKTTYNHRNGEDIIVFFNTLERDTLASPTDLGSCVDRASRPHHS